MAEVLFNIVIFVFFVLIVKGFFKENTEGSDQDPFSKEVLKTLLGLDTDKPDPNDSRDFMENFREKYQTSDKGHQTQVKPEKKKRGSAGKNLGLQNNSRRNTSPNQRQDSQNNTSYQKLVDKRQNKVKHGTPAVKEAAAENLAYMEEKYHNEDSEFVKNSRADKKQFPSSISQEALGSIEDKSLTSQSSNRNTNRENSDDPYSLTVYTNNVSPKKLKQAMVMKEILDKPKSLQ